MNPSEARRRSAQMCGYSISLSLVGRNLPQVPTEKIMKQISLTQAVPAMEVKMQNRPKNLELGHPITRPEAVSDALHDKLRGLMVPMLLNEALSYGMVPERYILTLTIEGKFHGN